MRGGDSLAWEGDDGTCVRESYKARPLKARPYKARPYKARPCKERPCKARPCKERAMFRINYGY